MWEFGVRHLRANDALLPGGTKKIVSVLHGHPRICSRGGGQRFIPWYSSTVEPNIVVEKTALITKPKLSS